MSQATHRLCDWVSQQAGVTVTRRDQGSLSYNHTHSPRLSETHRAPLCLWLGPGVTAQRPGHTFSRAGPPHPPCHPQSRADTVQRPPSVHPAPQPSRPAPVPGLGPSFPGPGASPRPADSPNCKSRGGFANRSWPGLESRPEDAQVPGQGSERRVGTGARKTPGQDAGEQGRGCGIRRAGQLPQRRGEAGGATRVLTPPAPAARSTPQAEAPRALLTWSPRNSSRRAPR